MVAFLQRLSGLGPEQYRRLAYGERVANAAGDEEGGDAVSYLLRTLTEPLQVIVADCARCHGADGNGRGLGAFPKIAGQREDYLFASLLAFSSGERLSGIMQPVAAGLSEETLRALARYYARMAPPPAGHSPAMEDSAARGGRIAAQGIPARGVPSCVDCHGPGREPRNSVYPELAGQYAVYLVSQLQLFKVGKRGGTPYAHIMYQVAGRLTQAQIHDLAAYYASLARKTGRKDRAGRLENGMP
jgi:cytochrome c553